MNISEFKKQNEELKFAVADMLYGTTGAQIASGRFKAPRLAMAVAAMYIAAKDNMDLSDQMDEMMVKECTFKHVVAAKRQILNK